MFTQVDDPVFGSLLWSTLQSTPVLGWMVVQ